MIQLAYKNGYGVMPCESRGEGASIADYCVGINAGSVRECGIGGHRKPLHSMIEIGARFKGKVHPAQKASRAGVSKHNIQRKGRHMAAFFLVQYSKGK